MTNFTPQQRRAIGHDGSVVLSSGAGCGKTSVLTERYLWYLTDRDADVERLVAITFTDKAAREMRKRIREAIEGREKSTTGADRERWRAQLRALETAEISTIHSFCGNLLRRHALAADLDPGFQVLDAVVAESLLADAVRDMLMRLLTEESPSGESLRNLIRLYGWQRIRREIPELVRAGGDWTPFASETPDQLAERWRMAAHKGRRDAVEYHRRRLGLDATIRRLQRLDPIGPKLRNNLNTLLDCWPSLNSGKDLAGLLTTINDAARVLGTEQKKAFRDADDYEFCKDSFTLIREGFCKKLADVAVDPTDLTAAAVVGLDFLRVATACRAGYDRAKAQHGGLDFDDLLLRARNLLRDREDVAQACRERIQYLLVDELQDTDPVQMEIVQALVGDVGSGKLFAVGDAMQSIYRFRGAEVELFEQLGEAVPARHSLTANFRSRQGLLDFVNGLFGGIPNYEPLTAGRSAPAAGPCVEFLWGGAGGEKVKDVRQREALRVARRMKDMIDKKELTIDDRKGTPPGPRPVAAKDVVLLFRSMSNVMYYESALRSYGFNYYLVGGRAFYAQQEVSDLSNLLLALENPNDSAALVGVMRSPFGCLSDDAIVMLAGHPDGYWAATQDDEWRHRLLSADRERANRLATLLPQWREDKDRKTIVQLLSRVMADTGYDAALRFEFLGDRKVANLWKLTEEARTFDRAGRRVVDFIQHLDRVIAAQPREEQAATQPEDAEVVRLMSIHQAKGLEFPVVILPDLNSPVGNVRSPVCRFDRTLGPVVLPPKEDGKPLFSDYPLTLWNARERHAEWDEAIRIFYVACTRAADYLVLSGSLPEPFDAESTAMHLLSERFDIDTGVCHSDANVVAQVRRPGDEPRPKSETSMAVEGQVSCDGAKKRWDPDLRIPPAESPRWMRLFRQALVQCDPADGGWRTVLKTLGAGIDDRRRIERLIASAPFQRFLAADERHAGWVASTDEGEPICLDLLWKEAAGWYALCLDGPPADHIRSRLRERFESLTFVGPE